MLRRLIREVDERFDLGDTGRALLIELLTLIFDGRAGGVPGLMRKFHQQGLGYLVESWAADVAPVPLQPRQFERLFDSGKLSAMANRLGLARTTAIAAACGSLPELVRLLTRGGRRPSYLPSDVSADLAQRHRTQAPPTSASVQRRPIERDSFDDAPFLHGFGWVKWAMVATCLIALGLCMLQRQPAAPATTPSAEDARVDGNTAAHASQ
jgi:uncharacterized protein YidB (DUF937 family)